MLKRARGQEVGLADIRTKPLSERPSYWLRPALKREGKKWFVLYGENIQDGVAGFGDTPDEAFADFDKQWFTHRGPSGFTGEAVIARPVRVLRNRAKRRR